MNKPKRGASLADLCKQAGQKTMEFEHEGLTWEVHYRTANWKVRCNAIESAWKETRKLGENGQVENGVMFDTAQYYEEMLMHCIMDINGEKLTIPVLREFDPPVITKLLACVPAPNLMADLAESKKESAPSTEEGTTN